MKLTRQSVLAGATLVIGGLLGASALVAMAQVPGWNPPSQTPPNGNVAAPINVGGGGDPNTYSQIKTGLLGLKNLVVDSLMVTAGASTTPGAVLVNDGTGVASWGNGGGGSSGVTSIIAGTNITINPTSGTGNVTVNASNSGTVGGGCYLINKFTNQAWDVYATWGNATVINATPQYSYGCQCPSGYTMQISGKYQDNTSIWHNTGYLCIKN